MIETRDLIKEYGGANRALSNVNLRIEENGVFGLVGPNGAGKTTLIRILLTLLQPTSGKVFVFGRDTTDHGVHALLKQSLGYLPQELGLYAELTGIEFLKYICALKRIPRGTSRKSQIADVIELVGLGSQSNQRIQTYSGGMKRRLGIAQALLGKPKLLILDEPTTGVDPEERVRLRNVFSNLAQECIVLLSTHIIEDVSQICRCMFVLHHGSLLFEGSPDDLIQQAVGKVWRVTTPGDRPEQVTIVSSLQFRDGVHYRVIGETVSYPNAELIEPSLEDGYLWLIERTKLNQVS